MKIETAQNTPSISDCLAKDGIVERIENQVIYVRILSVSACASCHAKGACSSMDSREQLIEVDKADSPDVKPGDMVQISMKALNGNVAVVYGYVIPFLVLIFTMIILVNFVPEGLAGLLSIAMLAPYYTVLYLRRNQLKQRFRFRIE